jgi:hypothetical protein
LRSYTLLASHPIKQLLSPGVLFVDFTTHYSNDAIIDMLPISHGQTMQQFGDKNNRVIFLSDGVAQLLQNWANAWLRRIIADPQKDFSLHSVS